MEEYTDAQPSTSTDTSDDPNDGENGSPSSEERVKQTSAGWFESATEHIKRFRTTSMLSSLQQPKDGSRLKDRLWTAWNNMKYSDTWMSDRSGDYGKQGQIVLLGEFYAPRGSDGLCGSGFNDFLEDYYSKIWITYRTNMRPFANTKKTTDCGWGCMIRSTQMMVAQAILVNRLSRDWRFRYKHQLCEDATEELSPTYEFDRSYETHLAILRLFEDCPDADLGIHRLLSFASDEIGEKAVGRWYAPSETISLIRRALRLSTSPLTADLTVMLVANGVLRAVEAECLSHNWVKKLVIFVTVRLGTTTVNKGYFEHIRQLFSMKSCLGILGGRPDHSLYFVGYYDKQVIYLDPHVARDYSSLDPVVEGAGMEEADWPRQYVPRLKSYHCELFSKMPMSQMDPSCAIGFLVSSKEEFDDTMKQLALNDVVEIGCEKLLISEKTRFPLFTVMYGEGEGHREPHPAPSEAEKASADQHGFELL